MVHVPDSPVTFAGGFSRRLQSDRALAIGEERNQIQREQAEQAAAEANSERRRQLFEDALAPIDQISEMVVDPKDGNDFAIFYSTPAGQEQLEDSIALAKQAVTQAGGDPTALDGRIRLLREQVRFKAGQSTGLSAVLDEFVKANQKINPEFEAGDVSGATIEQFAGVEPGSLQQTFNALEQAAVDAGLDPKEAVPFEFKKSLAVAKSKGMTVNVGNFTKDDDGNLVFSPAQEGGGAPQQKIGSVPVTLLAEDRQKVSQLKMGVAVGERLLAEMQREPTFFGSGGEVKSTAAGAVGVLQSIADLVLSGLPGELEEESREIAKELGVTEPSETSKKIGSLESMENRLVEGLARARDPGLDRITNELRATLRKEVNLRGLFEDPGKVEGRLTEIILEMKEAQTEAQRIGEQNVGGAAKTPKFERSGEELPTFSSASDPGFEELPVGAKFLDGNGKERTKLQ